MFLKRQASVKKCTAMKKSLFRSESFKKGFILSSALNFFSKFIAFFNTVVIAYIFGTSTATDVLFFCTGFIGAISAFLTALNSSILIPESMRIKEQQSLMASQQFLSFFMYLYIAVTFLLMAAVMVNPQWIFSHVSKFNLAVLDRNAPILYLAIPLLILITINSFYTDILISYKYFSISVLSSFLNSVSSIAIVVCFHKHLHVLSILFSMLFANILQLILSVVIMKTNLNWSFRYSTASIRRKTIIDGIVAEIGNFSTLLANYLPLFLISSFSAGILSSVNYASRIPDFIALFITAQFGMVTGIKFNELYAQKRNLEIGDTFVIASAFLQFILIPICILAFIFSHDIITIVFGHGAFDPNSIANTSEFMKYFVLVLPLTAHNTLVARLFMATQKIRNSFGFQMIMGAIMCLAIFTCIKLVGPAGFPVGVLVAFLISVLAATIIMKRNFAFIPYTKTLLYSVKCILVNAPLLIILLVVNRTVHYHSIWYICTAGVMYCGILLAVNQILKINSAFIEVFANMAGRLKRPR
jgi:peptidoglycan biosynthesis protein MviN/MurJ (putative lipid II flippase)